MVLCQQRKPTPPDTWSCHTLGLACVLMLRPISCFRTFEFRTYLGSSILLYVTVNDISVIYMTAFRDRVSPAFCKHTQVLKTQYFSFILSIKSLYSFISRMISVVLVSVCVHSYSCWLCTIIVTFRCYRCGGDGRITCDECDGYRNIKTFIELTVTL